MTTSLGRAARFVRNAQPLIEVFYKQYIPAQTYDEVGEPPSFWSPGPDDLFKADGFATVDGKEVRVKGRTLSEAVKSLESQIFQMDPGAKLEAQQVELVRV